MRLCDGIYGVLRGMQLFKLSKSNKYLPDTEQIIKSEEKKYVYTQIFNSCGRNENIIRIYRLYRVGIDV